MTRTKQLPAIAGFLRNNAGILFILLVAACFRFYQFTSIPYMHDELSALVRTQYHSFSDLLEYGVMKGDTHPALIQSFLYFWTQLFGYSEWIVKLPFLLMSLGSIYLAYRIGKRWFHETAGLLVAVIFATSEYTLMYGQIIRPYGSGLFFTLLLTYHWSELVFYARYQFRHYFFYVLGAVLCSYNHHFSLLIAALIGISGLFWCAKEFRLKYTLISLLIPVLYLPHLGIFLHQLAIGGVEGWLGKPQPDFIWHYLFYVFHFSWLVIGSLVIVFIVFRLNGQRKAGFFLSKQQVFSGSLFLINYGIAYFYSIYGSSVLQSSVLLFSFPFLLFFFAGFLKEQKQPANLLAIGLLIGVFGYTLIWKRHYYTIFYVPTFKQLVLDANAFNTHHPKTVTLFFSDEPKTRFYEPELHIPNNYRFVQIPGFTLQELDELLRSSYDTSSFFCLAATSAFPPQYQALIQQYYPHLVQAHHYFSASTILFSKTPDASDLLTSFQKPAAKFLPSGGDPAKWQGKHYLFREGDEWGPGFQTDLASIVRNPNDFIDVYATLKMDTLGSDPILVVNCQSEDSVFTFLGANAKSFHWNPKDSTVTLVQSIKLIDNPYRRFTAPKLNTYIWNNTRKPIEIANFQVFYRKGNPYTYALYEPIY